jgi:methionyl-tRNA synthetase
MLIRKFDPAQLVDAYDVKEQMFYPWNDVVATPFGTAWLVVEPGRRTKPHNHHEGETFFILRGRGTMTVGGESRDVEPGDVVYLPPFGEHILENTSPHEDLHFLTIWWEDAAAVAALKEQPANGRAESRQKILTVAAGGGEDGPRRAAEIHARYARLCGAQVRSADDGAGGDEAAEDARAARTLYERLQAAGEIEVQTRTAPYCETCSSFRAAGEITGECPACGRWTTGGDGCRSCGESTEGGEPLLAARCCRCGQELGRRTLARLFFAPARHAQAITRHAANVAMSPRLRTLVDAALARGPGDVAVSQVAAAGVPVPMAGLDAQRFDPRFVRAARLLGGCGGAALADEQPVVFLDAGQAFLYAVLLPAFAAAAGVTGYAPAALVDCVDCGAGELTNSDTGTPESDQEVPAEWQLWLDGLGQRIAREHQGQAPPTQAWTREQRLFVGKLLRSIEEAGVAYQAATFSPRRAARVLRDLVTAVAEFGALEQPWSRLPSRREESNTAVAVELLAAKVLAILAYPLAPDWSCRLWRGLGYSSGLGAAAPGMEGGWEEIPTFVPSGHPIRGLDGTPAMAPTLPTLPTPPTPA